MQTVRTALTTLAMLLAAAFMLAACSTPEPQTETESPAAQTQQQASASQQTTTAPAAAAPTATLPPANTPRPRAHGDASAVQARGYRRTAGIGAREHRNPRHRQGKDRPGDSRHRKLD